MAVATDAVRESRDHGLLVPQGKRRPWSNPAPFLPWPDADRRGRLAGLLLVIACLGFFLFGASRGWSHNISDRHGFRQTQTALSAYAMLHGPWSLAYETPVVGAPWSIPFEFPVYQWTVAATALLSEMPLTQAGRLVSIIFFLLTLWPLSSILRRMHCGLTQQLLIGALVLASPFYVFWSRTFMIESTALFLAVSYLALVLRFSAKASLWLAIVTGFVGALAAAVKVTTFLPFAVAVLIILVTGLWRAYRQSENGRGVMRYCSTALVLGGVPLIALVLWTHFADSHKAANPIAREFTSQALMKWNFGTLDQRLSWQTWRTILGYEESVTGTKYAAAILVLGLLFGRRRLQILACLLLFLVAPCVFTNLYFIHDYYTYGSAILLLTGLGLSLVSLFERGPWLSGMATTVLCLLLGSFVIRYAQEYYPSQTHQYQNWDGIASHVKSVTQPNDTLLGLGYDWSSEMPFYCERRAVMVPGWLSEVQSTAAVFSLAMSQKAHHIVVNAAGRYNGFDVAQLHVLANANDLYVERAYQDEGLTIYRMKPRQPAQLFDPEP
jgi:Dolichyl-phosphate-mannose-protein mannosyltransferase